MTITHLQTYDGSCKFWEIEVKNAKTTIRQGKMGTEGAKTETDHSNNKEAKEYAEEQIANKEGRGFSRASKRKNEVAALERPTKRTKVDTTAKKPITKPKAKKSGIKVKATTKPKIKKTKITKAKSTATAKPKAKKASAPKAKKAATPKAKKAATPKPKKAPAKPKAKKAAPTKPTTTTTTTNTTTTNNTTTETPTVPTTVPTTAPTVPAVSQIALAKDMAPMVWEVVLNAEAFGIYVNDEHVYTGDEKGLVQQFDKESGKVQKQYRLPAGVKCIVGDGPFLYVGCDDGSLYDITREVPRLMSKVEEFSQVYWMDIHHGQISCSDKNGKVALVNAEGETIWVKQEAGANEGWMCLKDETGVYHGHSKGVTKRSLENGSELWKTLTGEILFGQKHGDHVYASGDKTIYKLDKATGNILLTYADGGPSCSISDTRVIASRPFHVYNTDGSKKHEFRARETPFSMATWGEHEVFAVRENLVKYDFSTKEVNKVKRGLSKASSFSAESIGEIVPEITVEETTDTTGGILCKCIKEGDKLRIRVTTEGYISSWNVQFPRDIREEGAEFVVEKIITEEGFYRAWGDIKKVNRS